jgi:hypothetical protein
MVDSRCAAPSGHTLVDEPELPAAKPTVATGGYGSIPVTRAVVAEWTRAAHSGIQLAAESRPLAACDLSTLNCHDDSGAKSQKERIQEIISASRTGHHPSPSLGSL